MNSDILTKKNKSLKQAIERYNTYKRFVETYKNSKSLDEYVQYIRLTNNNACENTLVFYEGIINSYNKGNEEPLLTNLYDKLLAADEYKNKIANEIKTLLREV